MIEYSKKNLTHARELRKNMTKQERKLWYDFLRSYDAKFHRQKPIGSYIVDFYCHSAKLVIELDGGGHYTDEQMEKDLKRTAELEKLNLKLVRFSNLEVDNNFSGVCEKIDELVKELSICG